MKSIIDNILSELSGTPDGEALRFMLSNPSSFGPAYILQALRSSRDAGEITVDPPVDSSAITKWRGRNAYS